MESFTHEQYINVLRMQGKPVAVTPESLQQSQKAVASRSVADRWSRAMEEEDAAREFKLRELRKKQQLLQEGAQMRGSVAAAKIDQLVRSPEYVADNNVIKTSGSSLSSPVNVAVSISDVSRELKACSSVASVSESVDKVCVEMWWLGHVDLDLSCVALNEEGKTCGLFFFGEDSLGDAFEHSGDMLSAPGPNGAKETIRVTLSKISSKVQFVYFVMSAFSADNCDAVERLLVRIVDESGQTALAGVDQQQLQCKRAAALCRLKRVQSNSFVVESLSDLAFSTGDTVRSLTRGIEAHAKSSI